MRREIPADLLRAFSQDRALFWKRSSNNGYAPLPDFEEPQIGPVARPDLAARFPLVFDLEMRSRRCSARASIARCPAYASASRSRKCNCIPRRRRLVGLATATGFRSKRWRAAFGLAARFTQTSTPAWRSASMAGGRLAPKSASVATTPSGRMAPTSQFAHRPRCAPIRSSGTPSQRALSLRDPARSVNAKRAWLRFAANIHHDDHRGMTRDPPNRDVGRPVNLQWQLYVDSGRPLCANSSHSQGAWRTGRTNPNLPPSSVWLGRLLLRPRSLSTR